MTATVDSVLSLAMTLSDQDRAIVAEQLMDSVPGPVEDLSDEMKSTLDRRWDEIVSGKVKCRDAFEVLGEQREKYNA